MAQTAAGDEATGASAGARKRLPLYQVRPAGGHMLRALGQQVCLWLTRAGLPCRQLLCKCAGHNVLPLCNVRFLPGRADKVRRGAQQTLEQACTCMQVDAFASEPFSGNPAAVCLVPHHLRAALNAGLMQAIAMENNLSETAFVSLHGPSDSFAGSASFGLRWFTPAREVPLCGHATLASAWVLMHGALPAAVAMRLHIARMSSSCCDQHHMFHTVPSRLLPPLVMDAHVRCSTVV